MKMLKSMLFIPGDSEKKMIKGNGSNADALILDLEDSVASDRTALARDMVRDYLRSHADRGRQELWVRINPLSTDKALPDLAAIVAGAPDGIMLPKSGSAADVIALDHYLSALEQREGVAVGSIRILPVATETPGALFTLNSYQGASARLAALTWGAEDLAAAMGAASNRLENGEYEFTYLLARSLCLAAAHAAGVQAIDTVTTDFRNTDKLIAEVRASRRAGFTGKMAIHPDQVDPINRGYVPDETEIAHARAVIHAMQNAPGTGTVQLNGQMIDKPHLVQAQRVLASAGLRE